MKKTLLTSLFCAAITLSSIANIGSNKKCIGQTNNNVDTPKIASPQDAHYNGPMYYDGEEEGRFDDNNCFGAGEIGRYGKIKGTLHTNIAHPLFGDPYIYSLDEDWYIFTTPRRANYDFYFEAPNSHYRFALYRYHHDGYNIYEHEEKDKVFDIKDTDSTFRRELLPGSYFVRIYYDVSEEINKDLYYTLNFNYSSVASTTIRFSDYLDPFSSMKEVIVWQNDLIPSNVDRWGDASQQIYYGEPNNTYLGYLDPIFRTSEGRMAEQNGLDSYIFIFDKTPLKEIANNCTKLAQYVAELEDEQIKKIEIQKAEAHNAALGEGALFVMDVVATCVGGPVGVGLSVLSLTWSGISLFNTFRNLLQFENTSYPLNKTSLGWALCTLRENCFRALKDPNLGIKLPKFTRLQNGKEYHHYPDLAYWCTSTFEPKIVEEYDDDDNNNYYLVNKNDYFSSEFDFTDYSNITHHYYGTFSYYKDMDDFASKTNFSFGNDIQQNTGGTVVFGQPAKALKSIGLSGNYKTTYLAGESLSTSGMCVVAKYTNGDTRYIYSGFSVDTSKVNMNAEGRYTVLISFTDDYVTKYATYKIDVKLERQTRYAFTFLFINTDYMEVYSGHAVTPWYYIDATVPIPFFVDDWRYVNYIDYQAFGNLDIFDAWAYPDITNGVFHVSVRMRNNQGMGIVYINFSYETLNF